MHHYCQTQVKGCNIDVEFTEGECILYINESSAVGDKSGVMLVSWIIMQLFMI